MLMDDGNLCLEIVRGQGGNCIKFETKIRKEFCVFLMSRSLKSACSTSGRYLNLFSGFALCEVEAELGAYIRRCIYGCGVGSGGNPAELAAGWCIKLSRYQACVRRFVQPSIA